ncbi:hypothetical protein CK203_063310 [Vitis vinifera]|uniref:Uncharacterized protein n=1 Tax=Vitis vinifera TaxID=29760 RepID=A0A438G4W1_VITVI|nr:hypothetical protein CK203_063310 [Vitis vinifera]
MSLDNSSPIAMLRMEILTTQVGGIIQIFHGSQEHLSTNSRSTISTIQQASSLEQAIVNLSKDGWMQNDLSQKIDNLQYSISRLTNLNTVQEKGRFPSQPHQNPRVSMKWKLMRENLHRRRRRDKEEEEMKGKKKDISEGKEDHDSTVNANPEKELIKEELMKKRTSPPFPQALHGKKGIKNASEILEVLRQVNKCIIQCKSPLKYKDPGCPTISVMIGGKVVEKALLDLGASVNLLPYSVYKQLGLVDFVVLDTDPLVKEANYVPIILGRPFLATSNAIINCRNGLMQLTFGNMTLELNIFHMSKKLITPEEEEGPEEKGCLNPLMCLLLYKVGGGKEILPLFNKEEER